MNLHDFLLQRIALAAHTTEDVLASFLPLLRETIEAHRAGQVAPLEGLADLHVDGQRIWFEEARRQAIRRNPSELKRVEQSLYAPIEIVDESRRVFDVGDATREVVRVEVGERGQPLERPVYLPGYVSWEHELQHHDPLTDIFNLGLILASLACGLDLNVPENLHRFVETRRNLFALNPELHPVMAQVILRMTELDRHQRAQDLSAVLLCLENYRDQSILFDIDLARLPGLQSRDAKSKSQAILAKLRDRLFDVSRRNSLLHFRPTLATVNLSQSSIPLMLDIRSIREDQILVWNESLRQKLVDGDTISLNKYLNFAEAVYLPSLLERVIADARRDQQEFGFLQLRLVLCFLSWANLKDKPVEHFVSPLVLLAVKLSKSKGIRDTYHLEALTAEAEVNPVVRHQFRQLYNIELPETVDLAAGGLESLFEYLQRRVQASEPAVSIQRIDRPRIDLIHEKAKRRLDQYRRHARVSGRGVRSFLDLDYSYDPVNFHPLGVKLFLTKVRKPSSRLREIIEQHPCPRSFAVPEPDANVVEAERAFYQLRDASEENPYLWNLDLCSLTLANFRYRRMSLVRDYEALLDNPRANPAFDATFSLSPRPVEHKTVAVPKLSERFDVVPADPTQAAAIGESQLGNSYIIQGPPGTGKSQTITNLIADFVSRGKRVLFVCEKRAAIDVVYARLRQCGLESLCCLVHDSQTDKKEFVQDLKQTYETFLAPIKDESKVSTRDEILKDLDRQLTPLSDYAERMLGTIASTDLPLRRLLDRCIELRDQHVSLSDEQLQRLPDYSAWWQNREQLAALEPALRELQSDGILAHHPLRYLSPRLAHVERPQEVVHRQLPIVRQSLEKLIALLGDSHLPQEHWQTFEHVQRLIEYARRCRVMSDSQNMVLLNDASQQAKEFTVARAKVRERAATFEAARQLNANWTNKFSPTDLTTATQQAKQWENNPFAFLFPAWWRLRGALNRSYNFRAHAVRPSWTQVLATLAAEYDAQADCDQLDHQVMSEFGLDRRPSEFDTLLGDLRQWLVSQPVWLQETHQLILQSPQSNEIVAKLLAVDGVLQRLTPALTELLDGIEQLPLNVFKAVLAEIAKLERQVPHAVNLLHELESASVEIAHLLRNLPLTLHQAEAVLANRTWEGVARTDRQLDKFRGKTRVRHAEKAESLYDDWLAANARYLCRRFQERFLEHVQSANVADGKLLPEQRQFKKAYGQGRRTLEHEFGKSMRYRAIRELVDGDTGLVVRDLKPVWLMSPLSVSDTLPLAADFVDVVIFDEASQVPLEESIPSLFRGKQVIVVGDEMQLPPTDFFATKQDEEDEEVEVREGEQWVRVDLTSDSFLNHAAKNLPATMLGWHYRSRSESLISFSNWAFYDGRLLTVPDQRLPVVAQESADGCDLLLSRPLSFHRREKAVYENRRNRVEAEYVAQMVRQLLERDTGLSIGVIAFSEAQQSEIQSALQRLAEEDDAFRQRYEEELVREDDGQFNGLLVKNLENIQGDERDVIILSVCYGPGPSGKMLMNFGPINQSGGEKRLNVAFSRAKKFMAVVTSIRAPQITNDYNEGANCLKNYLQYAESMSRGDAQAAHLVLGTLTRRRDATRPQRETSSDPVCQQLASELRRQGWIVEMGIGQSHFRVDLAVRRQDDAEFLLGILVDRLDQYERSEALERELLRPRLLRAFGWRVTTVLAKDWYDDPAAELKRVVDLLTANGR